MTFDVLTRTILEHYTAHPPTTEDVWYGPWTSILTTLFPTTQGYMVTPQRRLSDDSESHIPDFIIEVARLSTPPLTLRTVLVVEIKNPSAGSRPELKPSNGSLIDKLMLHSQALLTQNCTGLAQSDLIGGTEKGRTMGKICVHSLTGIIPLTTQPHIMTFEFLSTWSLLCTYSFFNRT